MTEYQAAGYYCVIDSLTHQPDATDCLEGRLALTTEGLVCAVNDDLDGYTAAVDAYSGSTVRRLFGGKYDPQTFQIEDATSNERTVAVPYDSIVAAELCSWEGSDLRGATAGYGVFVRTTTDDFVLQLGRGERNRGSGQTRHTALASELESRASGQQSTTSDAARPNGRTASNSDDTDWLTTDAQSLIVTNDSHSTVAARIGLRTADETHILEDISLETGETKRWDDIPQQQVVDVGAVIDDETQLSDRFEMLDSNVQIAFQDEDVTVEAIETVPTATRQEQSHTSDSSVTDIPGYTDATHSVGEASPDSRQSNGNDESAPDTDSSLLRPASTMALGLGVTLFGPPLGFRLLFLFIELSSYSIADSRSLVETVEPFLTIGVPLAGTLLLVIGLYGVVKHVR